jgi:hypothetical protein
VPTPLSRADHQPLVVSGGGEAITAGRSPHVADQHIQQLRQFIGRDLRTRVPIHDTRSAVGCPDRHMPVSMYETWTKTLSINSAAPLPEKYRRADVNRTDRNMRKIGSKTTINSKLSEKSTNVLPGNRGWRKDDRGSPLAFFCIAFARFQADERHAIKLDLVFGANVGDFHHYSLVKKSKSP